MEPPRLPRRGRHIRPNTTPRIRDPRGLLGRGGQAHPLVQASRPGSRTPISGPARSRSAGSRTASRTSPIIASTGICRPAGDQVAIIWEGDDPSESKQITYRAAARRGLPHGERHAQPRRREGRPRHHLPADDPRGRLRDARLRAASAPSIRWCSAASRRTRSQAASQDAKSVFVITADEGLRGGRKVPLKANVDAAHRACRRRRPRARRAPHRNAGQHGAGPRRLLRRGRPDGDRRVPGRRDERGGPALHPLHLRLDRPAEGRAAHHRRLSRLCGDDAPIRLRLS